MRASGPSINPDGLCFRLDSNEWVLAVDGRLIADSFRHFATQQWSPFERYLYSVVAQKLASSSDSMKLVGWSDDNPIAHALPLRLLAGLHALVRSGRAPSLAEAFPPNDPSPDQLWRAVQSALEAEADYIAAYLRLPVLNNELGRATAVLGACLLVSRQTGGLPFSLFELGASAGLNLLFDKYFFDFGDTGWGDAGSPVKISTAWEGGPELCEVVVADRRGCDISPIDVHDAADRERLLAYAKPDDIEGIERRTAAMNSARDLNLTVDREDAVDWIERELAAPAATDRVRLVFNTVFWHYLDAQAKGRIIDIIGAAGRRATARSPLAWFRMEVVGQHEALPCRLQLTIWPPGRTTVCGRADFQGTQFKWTTPTT
jgi:hypothetical protein